MDGKKEIVKTVDSGGKPIELVVCLPNHKVSQEVNMAYNLKVSSLIRQGATSNGERLLLRSEVEDYLLKAGIWTVEDAKTLQRLSISIRASELAIQRGGIALSDAKSMAVDMGRKRQEIMALVGKRQQLDSATVESVAENYKFGIMVIKCVRYTEDNKMFFIDYDDFLRRGSEEAVVKVSEVLSSMVYGSTQNLQDSLFETRWLKEAGFINKAGRLVDKKGRLVDENGHLVDEEGRYINEDGKFIDSQGVRVTENGDFVCENPKPFTDADGNEVEINLYSKKIVKKNIDKKATKKKTPKKRKKVESTKA